MSARSWPAPLLMLAGAALLFGCSDNTSTAKVPTSTAGATTPTTRNAPQPTPTFEVAPAHLVIGKRVTFSGTGCGPRDVVEVGIDNGGSVRGTSAEAKPRPGGVWSTNALVGDSSVIGTRQARATCFHGGTIVLSYKPVTVEVTTFRRLRVRPVGPVHPGTTLTVTQVGNCPQGVPYVTLNAGGKLRATAVVMARGTGDWSARLGVPPTASPGPYTVQAECDGPSRTENAFYPAVPIAVK
jgi:hypothetical protein